jgi:acetyl esterase/lipase
MAATLYLAGSIFILLVAASTWFQARRIGPSFPVYFFTGWLAGELALQVIAVGRVVTLAVRGARRVRRSRAGSGLSRRSPRGAPAREATSARTARSARSTSSRARPGSRSTRRHLGARTASAHRSHEARRRAADPARAVRRVAAGDKGGRNLLDIVLPDSPAPGVRSCVQIHGGGWMIGDKREQGGPLMGYLASRGWVCFAINYRLSPQAQFPAHIVDVKRALRWIREHAHEYGADPDFICVTGGSAGGHLTALTALSQNDPAFQPGFESADTSVSAAVPFYGVYDFLDRAKIRGRQSMVDIAAKYVFQCRPERIPSSGTRRARSRASPPTRRRSSWCRARTTRSCSSRRRASSCARCARRAARRCTTSR